MKIIILFLLCCLSCPPKPSGPYYCDSQKDCEAIGMICDNSSHLCITPISSDTIDVINDVERYMDDVETE